MRAHYLGGSLASSLLAALVPPVSTVVSALVHLCFIVTRGPLMSHFHSICPFVASFFTFQFIIIAR
jgi:hypothetical protein